MSVLMIRYVMAVTMHSPIEVFFEPVRMTVIRDHFKMAMDRLEHYRSVCERRHYRPNDKSQTQKCTQHLMSK